MAYQQSGLFLSLDSSGTLASLQYRLFDVSTGMLTELVTTANAPGVGILHDNTTEANKSVSLQFCGVSPVDCGGAAIAAINPGDLLTASTLGTAIPAAGTAVFIIGEAMGALSSGSSGVIAVKLIMAHGAT